FTAALNPTAYMVPLGAGLRLSGDPEAQRAAVIDLAAHGEKTFRSLDLRGAGLEGLDLSDADLRGTDLSQASLRGTDLSGARLGAANLAEADLSQADLFDADVASAQGFESARCDLGTVLPRSFACEEGRVYRVGPSSPNH
ncbi:MAG: pentapeptide repeat-containing protein, partial [Myxococcota bacterium]